MAMRHRLSVWALLAVCVFSLPLVACAYTSTPFVMITRGRNITVWQNFGPALMITEDFTDGRICYYYLHAYNTRMDFKTSQPGNWVPLGSAIKWLMFVGNYQGIDRLMAHNVDYHSDFIAKHNVCNQVGCGMVGVNCYFGQYRANKVSDHYPVDIYCLNVENNTVTPVCISDTEKSEFAHDCNLMVYRAHFGINDNRIYGIYLSGGNEFEIAKRNGFHPTVCGDLVAWAENVRVGYRIMGMNLSSGEIRTVAITSADPPCPEAGNGTIFWEDARNIKKTGLDIYGYDWATGREFAVTTAFGDQYRLKACGDYVTWVSGITNCETLWRADIISQQNK